MLTLPFDVIKTHRQIELGEAEVRGSKKLTSTWKLLSELYQKQGLSSLYAGLRIDIIAFSLLCAIQVIVHLLCYSCHHVSCKCST